MASGHPECFLSSYSLPNLRPGFCKLPRDRLATEVAVRNAMNRFCCVDWRYAFSNHVERARVAFFVSYHPDWLCK